jgi:hypothetical protein
MVIMRKIKFGFQFDFKWVMNYCSLEYEIWYEIGFKLTYKILFINQQIQTWRRCESRTAGSRNKNTWASLYPVLPRCLGTDLSPCSMHCCCWLYGFFSCCDGHLISMYVLGLHIIKKKKWPFPWSDICEAEWALSGVAIRLITGLILLLDVEWHHFL